MKSIRKPFLAKIHAWQKKEYNGKTKTKINTIDACKFLKMFFNKISIFKKKSFKKKMLSTKLI